MNNNKLGSSIAVMNAKGGVGKSTVTLAIAETLSYYYGKKVLVIDSDAQMSLSVMTMPFDALNNKRAEWKTLVGLLHQSLILGETPDWKEFVTKGVADVDDAETIDLLPGDLRLTLVERAVTEADRHEQMRGLVRSVLAEARLAYDYILIDCPPGLSLLTEIWLREADFHLAPARPDFLAIAGLEMFREFKKINPDLKMAENLGILVNMKDPLSPEDEAYHKILANDEESRCFPDAVPHMAPIQHAARYSAESRSFAAKYPGSAGEAFRNTVHEILKRTGDADKKLVEDVSQPLAGREKEVDSSDGKQPVEDFVIEEKDRDDKSPVDASGETDADESQNHPVQQEDIGIEIVTPEPVKPVPSARPAAAPVSIAIREAAGIASRFAPEPANMETVSAKAVEQQALAGRDESEKAGQTAAAPLAVPAASPSGSNSYEVP